MAYTAVQELDALLQSLQTLKAPGISKSKVEAATKLCLELQNIPVEPQLVDSFVKAFNTSPDTHKLGVLYIIDSVMRQWVVTGAAHAGGVRRMTDVMPTLMLGYLSTVPDAQKERLLKLLDIWASSKTFPPSMLSDFKTRLIHPNLAQTQQQPHSAQHSFTQQQPIDPVSLLAALNPPPPSQPQPQPQAQASQAQIQSQHIASTPQLATQAYQISNNTPDSVLASLASLAVPPAAQTQIPNYLPPNTAQPNAMSFPYPSNPVAPPPQSLNVAPQFAVPAPPAGNLSALAALLPNAQAGAQDPSALVNQLQILQTLSQSLGPDGLQTILQALGNQQAPVAPSPSFQPSVGQSPNIADQYQAQQPPYYSRNENRDRSRSPNWDHRRHSPPNRRESPTYGAYDPGSRSNDYKGLDDRGRRSNRRGGAPTGLTRNDYRQRSPQPTSRDSPASYANSTKPIAYDSKLGDNRIKVLSRTLFVGGVKTSEQELKNFFRQFGGVQSCIVNHEKRHAFLKLVTHQDAMATRQAVFNLPESDYRSLFERVNWAVGFGPTHCADYNIGSSIIPLDLLTDADRKWMLTAELGGTGGRPIQPGMVVEEPDIEIGTGPSSKAIHRRGGGQQQGRGTNSSRRGGGGISSPDQSNRQQQRSYNRHDTTNFYPGATNPGPPPSVPNFGAPIPGFPFLR